MTIIKKFSCLSLALFAMFAFTACNKKSKSSSNNIAYAQAIPANENGEVLAKVNGEAISEKALLDSLEGALKSQYLKAKSDFYAKQSASLDEVVFNKLVEAQAKKEGISTEALLEKEITKKSKAVTDKEVKAFYDDYTEKMKGNPRFQAPAFDTVKDQIKQSLDMRNSAERKQDYFNELTHKFEVTYYTSPPRLDVPIGDLEPKGNKDATVTIVEFSDFECPACRSAFDSVNEVMDKYKSKVKLYFRDFPLSFHKRSKPAHNAARCAADQGKFWQMHDLLFLGQNDWSKKPDEAASIVEFKAMAKKLKLDQAKFDGCVDNKTHYAKIDAELEAGQLVGVGGTPAFYVNGIPLAGAVPFAEFKKVIDAELARNAKK